MSAHLAFAVVAARDEAVAALVKGAVGEREDVRAQDLEEAEGPARIDLLLDEAHEEAAQLRAARDRDEGLAAQELVANVVNVAPAAEMRGAGFRA